jgi:hypothetical protein
MKDDLELVPDVLALLNFLVLGHYLTFV